MFALGSCQWAQMEECYPKVKIRLFQMSVSNTQPTASRRKLTVNTHFQVSIHIYLVNINTCFGPLEWPSSGVLQHRG